MKIKATIVGTSPLFLNPPPLKLGEPVPPDASDYEIAKKKVTQFDGKHGIFSVLIISTLKNAGRFHKIGKKQITTGAGSLVTSFLRIPTEFLPFSNGTDWKPDGRYTKNEKEQLIWTVRPRFDNWELEIEMDLEENAGVHEALILELLKTGGQKVGLGSFRIGNGGPGGAYEVTRFQVFKNTEVKKKPVEIEYIEN